MCIAIYKPKSAKKLDSEAFQNCWKKNPDGFWCIYQQADKVSTFKTLDEKEASKFFEDIQNDATVNDIVFHFRITTHGGTTLENCHPFDAWNWFYFVHNGILRLDDPFNEKSDTRILSELLQNVKIDWIRDEKKIAELAKFCGASKLIFLSHNEHLIINESIGTTEYGVWYSNTSYKTVTYAPLQEWKPWNYQRHTYGGYSGWQKAWWNTWDWKRQKQAKKQGKAERKLIEKYNKYKCGIQGYLKKDEREIVNELSLDESNALWKEYLGHVPSCSEQLEEVKWFVSFVSTLDAKDFTEITEPEDTYYSRQVALEF